MQPRIMSYQGVRIVNHFPPFPENSLGLRRGSYIHTRDERIAERFGFPVSQPIPLCYDGKVVRCNTVRWNIDGLLKGISEGVWEISDKDPVPNELIPQMERQMGKQVTAEYFWKNLWNTQKEFPEQFKLQTSPDVTADDLKSAAAAAGKKLFIHAEIQPGQISGSEPGKQSVSLVIGGSDNVILDCQIPLSIADMLSGDRFFLCQITS
jgi:hypothetical protein